MNLELEDEFGDILQKARDRNSWSQKDLANAVGLSIGEIERMENYEWIPSEEIIFNIANSLELHGPSLKAIANKEWGPEEPQKDSALDLICLNVFIGLYPVKCYLIRCLETNESAIVDTGGNPKAIIHKAREVGLTPSKILLTHAHHDHAGGLKVLDREYNCPTWIGSKEPTPQGSRDLKILSDGEILNVGKMEVSALSTPGHTPGGFSFKINKTILSGDAIFAGSMGRANSSFADLFYSISKVLFSFPDDTCLHPGHGPATTVGEEKSHNPFFSCNG